MTPVPTTSSGTPAGDAVRFEDAWALADQVGGWLTEAQGRLLWDSARNLTTGARIVEIGSHQGRSTVVLGLAAASVGARVTAIDPFVEGAMFGGQSTRAKFEANIAAAGLTDVVDLLPMKSQDALTTWAGSIDLLYIDGKHDYWTVTDDLRWVDHVHAGGHVLIHDAFSSVGVTLALLLHVLPSEHLTYVDRSGSLARFTVSRPRPADRLRMMAAIPWWLRNIAIKVLLRLRLHRVARTLGHESPYDPY